MLKMNKTVILEFDNISSEIFFDIVLEHER